jgi:hypothetical protein
MIRIPIVSLAVIAPLCLASIAFGQGPGCPPGPALDSLGDTEANGMMPVPGIPVPLPFYACGPTVITRGAPSPPDPAGVCTIPTEIVSMSLTGILDPGGMNIPITIDENPAVASPGSITSGPSGSLPAYSTFTVNTLVTIPGFPTFPEVVTVVEPDLAGIPPGSTTPGGPDCVERGEDVYAAGFPAHEHIPCPEKICCLLPLPNGRRIHLSERTCQRLQGQVVPGPCERCFPGQTPVTPSTWGEIKNVYYE